LGLVLLLIACYLIGSVPVGYLAGRIKGIDVRKHGSGNIGMTNVTRVVGRIPGLVVLAGDILKGVLATWLGLRVGGPSVALLGGLAAIIGHNWSVFLGGRGGRGVATSAGVLLTLSPAVALSAVGVWLATLLVFRYVSVASMVAGCSVPLFMLVYRQPAGYLLLSLVIAGLILNQHRPNIRRLKEGREFRIGERHH
jgi:glycerol-3-phosphate acyltransferase PlsY